jgi:uncharacterized repeat protein (TIGR03943 family)
MDDRTQGALLLAVGGVALRLGLTDAALAYVKAGLQPLLTVSGAMLVLLGIHALVRAFRAHPEAAGTQGGHDSQQSRVGIDAGVTGVTVDACAVDGAVDAHGHAHAGGPPVAWLLVLPLLALLLIAPPPLGAFAAARQSARPMVTTQTQYPPLPERVDGAVPLNMSEYVFRALYDADRSLEGERIRLTGFVTPIDGGQGGYLLTRFTLNCCAADATAITVEVRGDQVRPADTWLEVEGTWEPRPGLEPGDYSVDPPLFVAASARLIEAPSQPYEY